jgi:hypothetical protein
MTPMDSNINPYETPLEVARESPPEELRRPAMGTALLVLWLVEGGLKAFFVGSALAQGFNPLHSLVEVYPTWNRLLLFALLAFMIVETIGPWIGIYYLTGRRARTIPFDTAMVRTLSIAAGIALGMTMLLMLYCELASAAG